MGRIIGQWNRRLVGANFLSPKQTLISCSGRLPVNNGYRIESRLSVKDEREKGERTRSTANKHHVQSEYGKTHEDHGPALPRYLAGSNHGTISRTGVLLTRGKESGSGSVPCYAGRNQTDKNKHSKRERESGPDGLKKDETHPVLLFTSSFFLPTLRDLSPGRVDRCWYMAIIPFHFSR